MSVYSMPDTFLGGRGIVGKKTGKMPDLIGVDLPVGRRIMHKKSKTCSMFYVRKAKKKLSRERGLKSWEAVLKF